MLLNEKGEEINKNDSITEGSVDIKTIKASERTRAHLNSPGAIHRTFESEEDMVKSAISTYDTKKSEEHEADKAKGFDFEDIDSVKNFKTGYTPVGNTVLVKIIYEEKKEGMIFLPSGSGDSIKAVVVVPGLFVNNLKPGDVVSIKKGMRTPNSKPEAILPPMEEHLIKGIKFKELSYDMISGAYIERDELINRISQENAKLGYKND